VPASLSGSTSTPLRHRTGAVLPSAGWASSRQYGSTHSQYAERQGARPAPLEYEGFWYGRDGRTRADRPALVTFDTQSDPRPVPGRSERHRAGRLPPPDRCRHPPRQPARRGARGVRAVAGGPWQPVLLERNPGHPLQQGQRAPQRGGVHQGRGRGVRARVVPARVHRQGTARRAERAQLLASGHRRAPAAGPGHRRVPYMEAERTRGGDPRPLTAPPLQRGDRPGAVPHAADRQELREPGLPQGGRVRAQGAVQDAEALRMNLSETAPAAEQDPLLVERSGRVVTLTLHRPHRRNAMSTAMLEQLAKRLSDLTGRQGTAAPGALVLTGAGGTFSSGADTGEPDWHDLSRRAVRRAHFRTVFAALHEAPFPLVAAVEGYALGGGLEL